MTTLFKIIRKRGYLMLGYTFLKALGLAGLVLERILVEYNYAEKNNLLTDRGFFGYQEDEIGYYINLGIEAVAKYIEYLAELNLLEVYIAENGKKLIKINEPEIYNFERTAEINGKYMVWDAYLYKIQYDAIDWQ